MATAKEMLAHLVLGIVRPLRPQRRMGRQLHDHLRRILHLGHDIQVKIGKAREMSILGVQRFVPCSMRQRSGTDGFHEFAVQDV